MSESGILVDGKLYRKVLTYPRADEFRVMQILLYDYASFTHQLYWVATFYGYVNLHASGLEAALGFEPKSSGSSSNQNITTFFGPKCESSQNNG